MEERLKALLKSYLPMSEQSFLILLSLCSPRHGYGIMQTVSEQSGGRVTLGASTVYTVLYKMEQDSLIFVTAEVDRRKVYALTEYGLHILRAETARVTELSRFANTILNRGEQLLPAAN